MASVQKTYKSNAGATWSGIKDLRDTSQKPYDVLLDADRMDGKTVLITGASSGLGFAVSKNLASRGARVLMVCRRPAEKERAEVEKAGAGTGSAEVLRGDLKDFASIRRLVEELAERNERIDVAISNAAAVCNSARKTVDGFEEMLQVNALSPALLLTELVKKGLIPNGAFGGNFNGGNPRPRIVVVASEAHRSAGDLDVPGLETIEDYGMKESTLRYGVTKLVLLSFTRELSRRLTDVGVYALCPGPVASNIAREAPAIARPMAKLFFRIFFQSPQVAAKPVVYLAASPRIEGKPWSYQFLMRQRSISAEAESEETGRQLWVRMEGLGIIPSASKLGETPDSG